MNLSKFRNLPLRMQFSALAAVVLAVGVFVAVQGAQQTQENRSKASGTGGTGNCATLNTSTDDLYADNCTIPGGFNGSIFGNNNTIQGGLGGFPANIQGNGNLIMGGMNGTITGDGNEVCGGLNGGINGNNNIIHGGVGGPINGIGNQINVSGICGIIRQPTLAPTSAISPTKGPGTCADGIDNNQNELIDSGDPVCHTDGNQNNNNSYDPHLNETGSPTVTTTPTLTITPSVTTQPSITPNPTIPTGHTSVSLKLLLHGLGQGGDSANPNSGGNAHPLHPNRSAKVEIYNSQNALILTKEGPINFNSTAGNFTGSIDLGTNFATGSYIVKVKTVQFLRTIVPGIQTITAGQTNQLPVTIMVNGDINDDNTINILDYNTLMGCYSDFTPATDCSTTNKILTDLDDDGDVNQFDYNLFLRELANREGQ